jgi:hypothetical protein
VHHDLAGPGRAGRVLTREGPGVALLATARGQVSVGGRQGVGGPAERMDEVIAGRRLRQRGQQHPAPAR